MKKVLVVLFMLFSLMTKATSVYVSNSGNDVNVGTLLYPYKTISHSLSKTPDTIYVMPGNYDENLTINNPVVIFGRGATIEKGIKVKSKNVELIGLSIVNSKNYGVSVENSNLKMNSVVIDNCNRGILFDFQKNSSNIYIDSCEIKNNLFGVYAISSAKNNNKLDSMYVTNSLFSNNTNSAIYMNKVSNGLFMYNNFENNGTGIKWNYNSAIYLFLAWGNYENISIEYNNFIDCSKKVGNNPNWSASIIVVADSAYDATVSNININNNSFTTEHNGIRVGLTRDTKLNPMPKNFKVYNNNFNCYNKSIINYTRDKMIVGCNWYGSSEDTTVYKNLHGDIKYRPFYISNKPAPSKWYIPATTYLTTNITGRGTVYYGYNSAYNSDTLVSSIPSEGSGNYVYNWSNSSKSSSIIVMPTTKTTYWVEIKDTLGCAEPANDSFVVNVIDIRCSNQKNGGVVSVCQATLITPLTTPRTFTYTTQCVAAKNVKNYIPPVGKGYLGACKEQKKTLFNNDLNGQLYLFPNPSTGIVDIILPVSDGSKKVDVINSIGQIVYSTNTTMDEIIIDLNLFERGVYFIKVDSSTGSAFKKLILN